MKPTDRRHRARRLLADVLKTNAIWSLHPDQAERVLDVIEAHVLAFRARPVKRKGKRR